MLLYLQHDGSANGLRAPVPVLADYEMTVFRDLRKKSKRRAASGRRLLECVGKTGECEFCARIEGCYLTKLQIGALRKATHLFDKVAIVLLYEWHEAFDICEYLVTTNAAHMLPEVHVEAKIVTNELSDLLSVLASDFPWSALQSQYWYGHLDPPSQVGREMVFPRRAESGGLSGVYSTILMGGLPAQQSCSVAPELSTARVVVTD